MTAADRERVEEIEERLGGAPLSRWVAYSAQGQALCAHAPDDLAFLVALARDQAQLIHDRQGDSAAYANGHSVTGEEIDERVRSLLDADLRELVADRCCESRLMWFRPKLLIQCLAAEVLRLRGARRVTPVPKVNLTDGVPSEDHVNLLRGNCDEDE